MRLSDQDLHGRSVISADGKVIGDVALLFFDSDSWQVESMRVRLPKDIADELGASRGLFRGGTLTVPIRLVTSVGDAVMLSVSKDDVRRGLASGAAEASPPT